MRAGPNLVGRDPQPTHGDVVSECVYFTAKPAGPGGTPGPGYYYRYYLTYV